MIHSLPMRIQIDAAYTKIIATPDKPWTEIQRMSVCIHCFLAAPAIRQSSTKSIPKQGIICYLKRSLKTIHCFVVLAWQVEQDTKADLWGRGRVTFNTGWECYFLRFRLLNQLSSLSWISNLSQDKFSLRPQEKERRKTASVEMLRNVFSNYFSTYLD